MSTLGIVVVAGESAPTAASLYSIWRQQLRPAAVVVVVAPGIDCRTLAWLTATCERRGWRLLASERGTVGAAMNAGVERLSSEWALFLQAGDRLPATACAALSGIVPGVEPDESMLTASIRLTSRGLDELASIDPAYPPVTVDPAHPALRSVVWRRAAVQAVGGPDADLTGAVYYDLWLRMLAAGARTRPIAEVAIHASVENDSSLVQELGAASYAATLAAVTARHLPVLAADHRDVLEARARRISVIGRRQKASLRRHRDAEARLQDSRLFTTAPVQPGWRASPLSRQWGYDRGGPVDRFYIERFLADHASDIRGVVLEVQEADYTVRFGGDAVTRREVVDLSSRNAGATIVTDLRYAANIEDASFDCVILTQTVHVIDSMADVIAECHRILRPGGVLLFTAPAVSRVCLEYGNDGDLWRMTPAGARALLEPIFGGEVAIQTFGNAGAAAAFLQGAGRSEVPADVLSVTDPYNPLLVGARAVKPGGGSASLHSRRPNEGLVLLYHRVGGEDPDPHHLSVSARAFDQQMTWLSETCTVLPLDQLVEGAARGTLPPRAVAVTFDDGYLDTLAVAAPILGRLGLPATCFVMTDGLDGTHEFWWDQLAVGLLGDGDRPAVLDIPLPDGLHSMPTSTRGLRLLAHWRIYHALVHAGVDARDRAMKVVRAWAPEAVPGANCRRMTAGDIRRLADLGYGIGAHTVRHLQLPRLPRDQQVAEIARSRRELERIVGRAVPSLAYPFGAFDETSIEAAREAGVRLAFTCEPRRLKGGEPLLALPRLDPHTAQLDRFVARVDMAQGDKPATVSRMRG